MTISVHAAKEYHHFDTARGSAYLPGDMSSIILLEMIIGVSQYIKESAHEISQKEMLHHQHQLIMKCVRGVYGTWHVIA